MLDIKRVIAICFRMGVPLSPDDLERMISYDMDWMDTDKAHDSIKALVFAGWLLDKDGMLEPNTDFKGIEAPLGWQPRPNRLTDPIVNEEKLIKNKTVEIAPIKEKIVLPLDEETGDPRARVEKRLKRFIAKESGLDIEEIERRIERKVKSLKICTNWLALCLLSREQGLEMEPIIQSLSAS